MLTTYTTGSATVPLIASCSFVFEVVGFIINDFKKKKKHPWMIQQDIKMFINLKYPIQQTMIINQTMSLINKTK